MCCGTRPPDLPDHMTVALLKSAVPKRKHHSATTEGTAMFDEKWPRALPRDVPNYHQRQAAHLRALATNATMSAVKHRLLKEADAHERLAEEVAELS